MHESPGWDTPVLQSVRPVVAASRFVTTSPEAVERVADWMAFEEFAFPEGILQFDLGDDPDRLTDAVMLISCLNFAFSDFSTGTKFEVSYQGRLWSDTEAMFASLHRALGAGEPVLDGAWMANVTRAQLARLFAGNIELPMLDERVAILHAVGATLVERYDGRWHRWVRTCAPAMYAQGDGLVERLVAEFPRFRDVSAYHGHEVALLKLAQLSLWMLHLVHRRFGDLAVGDLASMTAFADYIVPVALRLTGITAYAPDLEQRIARGDLIPRDSDEEIEIRAHSLHATALLTEAINRRRPPALRLVIPQVDYRLWKAYHATFWPHHLTRTVMY